MAMKGSDHLWPKWASWALAAVVICSLATIVATINDIW
jgi:hypothetical protein